MLGRPFVYAGKARAPPKREKGATVSGGALLKSFSFTAVY